MQSGKPPLKVDRNQVLEFRKKEKLSIAIEMYEGLGDFVITDHCLIASFCPPKYHEIENFCHPFITSHPPLLTILNELNILAYTQDTVLLRGPTGVGKEVLATCLGPYRAGNFVSINCATITEHLAESILFGHVKGAFTGAINDFAGLFKLATNGVLFMDEVFELNPSMQAKLLRVIETRKARSVGSNEEYEVNCRLVMATCRDSINVRDDFYARICGFEYHIPPLSERPDDAELIMKKLCPTFPMDKIDKSHKHNVRRLVQQARKWTLMNKI